MVLIPNVSGLGAVIFNMFVDLLGKLNIWKPAQENFFTRHKKDLKSCVNLRGIGMIDNWIPIEKMKPPTNTDCKILVYTPCDDKAMRYRVVDVKLYKNLCEATHWQPCLSPED